jgi:uncharacterized repeat protein (TIGR02543 family)
LTAITIPNKVKTLYGSTFDGCTGLASVTIESGSEAIGDSWFDGSTSITSVTIPDTVKSIGSWAFDGCSGLTSITLPDNLESIGAWAFEGCTGLTGVILPDNLESVGSWAFEDCSSLSSATFMGNAPSLSSGAFDGCATNFKVYYIYGKTGFTNPWHGYPTEAIYPPGMHWVTFNAQGGTVSPTGKTVTCGQTYGALPTPARTGYTFGGWYTQANGGGALITAGSVVSIANNHALYAKWTATVKYTITTTVSNTSYGSAKGAGSYYKDTKCTLTAIPKSGYYFTKWTEGTATASTSAVYSFTVTKARTLKANFATIGTPKLSSAASAGYASIKLTWTSVSGAKGYEVYRATSSGGKYAKVKTVTGVTSATDTVPKTGTTYYYRVKAYCVAGSTTTTGGLSSVKSAKAVPAKAAGLTLSKASATSIKISYRAVAGATRYEICRATSKTGKYTVVQTTAALAYTNTSLRKGKTYYYKVRAYHLEGTTKVYGAYSDSKSLKL